VFLLIFVSLIAMKARMHCVGNQTAVLDDNNDAIAPWWWKGSKHVNEGQKMAKLFYTGIGVGAGKY